MTLSQDGQIAETTGPRGEEAPMDMQALYEESFKNLKEGGIVEGTVIAVRQDGVVVDIGYKSEGMIPIGEFNSAEVAALKVGERIQVYLEEREDSEGNLILSKEKAAKMKVWEVLEKSFEKGEVIDGRMISKVKGGMMVDIGVKAFLPGSQIDLHPVRDLDSLIGKTFPMKIIKMNHRRGNIVVSRRILLEDSRDKKRRAAMATLEDGQLIEGMVKNITEYGAFIDLGGIDGLLHITDMSWGRVNHPSEIVSVGDRVGVIILKYDKETGRVSLGLKQKTPDPWTQVEQKYPVGTRIKGRIVSITDYGAFVELEPGVEGLVHISEMSWSHEVRHPSKLVSVGDHVDVVVLTVDRGNRKISLGMKQVMPNPWTAAEGKYPIGSRVTGKIKGLTDFGAFVGLEEGIDGLIHISDMSWTKRLTHPSELFKKGQPVEAVVLKVDKEKERLSLGFKQLQTDPWETGITEKYRVGDVAKCKIVKVTDFGIFVELEDGVEGLIHVSETGIEPSSRIGDAMQINDVIRAQIIKMDLTERKIALSIRAYKNEQERAQKKDK
ncbi:MAG: 30S ribosomal protein S1 [Nitrospirae bacterium]|nr:30S ribosomal protein S1 [Nitrospirota bacterium]